MLLCEVRLLHFCHTNSAKGSAEEGKIVHLIENIEGGTFAEIFKNFENIFNNFDFGIQPNLTNLLS